MSITDPIANMLTRVRNANAVAKDKVDIKRSKINIAILGLLKNEKFIQNYKEMSDQKQGSVRVYLKYDEEGNAAIHGLDRVSKPGLRIYVKSDEIKSVLSGLGINVISTSQGLMTGSQAKEKKLGGEIICRVW